MDHPRNFNFEYVTIIYNLIEAYFAIVFGIIANSIGLIAFGIDSMAEAGLGLLFMIQANLTGSGFRDKAIRQKRKTRRWVMPLFFLLGIFLLFEPARRWIFHDFPKPTLAGMIIAMISLLITPVFAVFRYKTSFQLTTLVQNLRSALVYMILPFLLLIGLGLNYYRGYWWAELILAIVIALLLFKRGFEINNE